MADVLRRLRRAATQFAIRQTIAITGTLPTGLQRSIVRSLVALAGSVPMLRRRVRTNMRLALGDNVPSQAEHMYFRNVAWFLSNAVNAFHRGFAETSLAQSITFDESVLAFDEAVAEGRGVVIVAPHWIGHELIAAAINLRHPLVLLVRDAPTPERAARKLKWYRALGAELVLRPHQAPTVDDALAYLRVLRQGKTLAITPDLLADAEQGIATSIFGRPARIHGGAFLLAISARAPMIRVSGHWQPEIGVRLRFERAPHPGTANRDAAVRVAVQDWCRWFEDKLRLHPDYWLFWLDKRWSRFLRTTPRAPGAE